MSDSPSQYEIHAQVEEVFRALDEAGINWLLFRGEERMQKPTGDIDVLIASRDLEMTDKVLAKLGFSRQGSALLVTRRAYVAYVPEDNLWLRIDLVTRVAFGELLEFDTSAAGAFLAAKRRLGCSSSQNATTRFGISSCTTCSIAGISPCRGARFCVNVRRTHTQSARSRRALMPYPAMQRA